MKVLRYIFISFVVLQCIALSLKTVSAKEVVSKFDNFSFEVSDAWRVDLHRDYNVAGVEAEYLELNTHENMKNTSISIAGLSLTVSKRENIGSIQQIYTEGVAGDVQRGVVIKEEGEATVDGAAAKWYVGDDKKNDQILKGYIFKKDGTIVVFHLYAYSSYFKQYEKIFNNILNSFRFL